MPRIKTKTRCLRNHHDITFLYKTWQNLHINLGGHHGLARPITIPFNSHVTTSYVRCPWQLGVHHGQLGVPTTHCYASHHPCPIPPCGFTQMSSTGFVLGHRFSCSEKKLTTEKYIWHYIVAFLKDSHFEQFFLYIIRLGWMRSNKQWIQGVFPSLNKFPWQNEVHCPSTELDGHLGKVPWHSSRWNPQFPKSLATLDVFPLDNTFWCICKCIIYIQYTYLITSF